MPARRLHWTLTRTCSRTCRTRQPPRWKQCYLGNGALSLAERLLLGTRSRAANSRSSAELLHQRSTRSANSISALFRRASSVADKNNFILIPVESRPGQADRQVCLASLARNVASRGTLPMIDAHSRSRLADCFPFARLIRQLFEN